MKGQGDYKFSGIFNKGSSVENCDSKTYVDFLFSMWLTFY